MKPVILFVGADAAYIDFSGLDELHLAAGYFARKGIETTFEEYTQTEFIRKIDETFEDRHICSFRLLRRAMGLKDYAG